MTIWHLCGILFTVLVLWCVIDKVTSPKANVEPRNKLAGTFTLMAENDKTYIKAYELELNGEKYLVIESGEGSIAITNMQNSS